jgi:hypothetical protein
LLLDTAHLRYGATGIVSPSTHAMTATDPSVDVPSRETTASAFPWVAPTPPSLDSDAAQRLIAALPENIFQLIVREAYLFRAGQIILQARSEAKARHDLVSSTRPPFLAFRRSETKETFNASLASANEELALYDRAGKRNADAMKRLRQCAELHIEEWLRKNDAAYHAGLVSESLVADWRRCLNRLELELSGFIAAVGCARNSLVSSQADANGIRFVSSVSRKAITQAAGLGAMLANEVTATNALADERDRQLKGTAFESTFPRLPAFDFDASMQQAARLPVPQLQQQFGLILERCAELRSAGLPALLEQVRRAEEQHSAVKDSYLVGVWQSLREFALAHYVEEHDLNDVAQATERMFEQGVFA